VSVSITLENWEAYPTYLDTTEHGHNVIALEHIYITGPDGVPPGLHPHVGPVSDTGIELLQAAHRIPSVIDEYLVLRISIITGIHDKAGQVTDAVNPEWVAVEVARGSLKLDHSGSFVLFAVENDFPNGLVVFVIVYQRGKELVDHSSLHAVSLA
jgi:hypothetical protein